MELQERLIALLREGASITAAAAQCKTTVGWINHWLKVDTNFAESFARAREEGYAVLAEELLDIADEDPGILAPSGATDSGAVQHMKLRIDTRKWILSKMLPKVYGDRLQLDAKIDAGDDLIKALAVGKAAK